MVFRSARSCVGAFAVAALCQLPGRACAQQFSASGSLQSHTQYASPVAGYTNSDARIGDAAPVSIQLNARGISGSVHASYGSNYISMATDYDLLVSRYERLAGQEVFGWGGSEGGLDSSWSDSFMITDPARESGGALLRFKIDGPPPNGLYYQLYINDFFFSNHPIHPTANGFQTIVVPFTNGLPFNVSFHLMVLGGQSDSAVTGDAFSAAVPPGILSMAATCELTQILVPPGASFAAASAYGYPVIATSSLLEVLPNTDSSRITLHWIGAPDYTHLETTTDLEDPNSWVPAEISQATIVDGFDITVDFLTEGPVRYFRLSTSGP